MVSALVAAATFLPLLFSQPCQKQISKWLRYLGSKLFPTKARCEALTWSAVRDGPLHVCQPIYCSHWFPGHGRRKECWRFITDVLFTETAQRQNYREFVEKPEALDLFGGTYLCIDIRVLMALILCSVKDAKSTSWREGAASYDDDFALSLRSVGLQRNLLVGHVRGHFKKERVQYTKAELTALMNGYPPWYREHVVCAHGPLIPFPIRNDADITRGGWVVAVGLADSDNGKPMALYTCPNLPDQQADGSYFARTNGAHLRISVQRVHDILKNLKEHITNEPRLDAVIEAVRYMIETRTGSGVERYLPRKTVTGGSIQQLTGMQCTFAMDLFNRLVPTDAEVQNLRPILAPVLQAVFDGCYEIIQYLKDTGMRLVLPQGLGDDWSRKIYLRDCVVDET